MSKQGRPSGFPKDAWALLDGSDARAIVRRAWGTCGHRTPPTTLAIIAETLGTPIETVQERLAATRQAKDTERSEREAGRIVVHCDGACEPRNPGGTATFGWVARRGGELLASEYGVVTRGPRATNNLAEYTAIIKALGWLEDAGHAGETIVLRSDSQLAIYQLIGTYAVRSPVIWPLWSDRTY